MCLKMTKRLTIITRLTFCVPHYQIVSLSDHHISPYSRHRAAPQRRSVDLDAACWLELGAELGELQSKGSGLSEGHGLNAICTHCATAVGQAVYSL